jgi:hypothetical protein
LLVLPQRVGLIPGRVLRLVPLRAARDQELCGEQQQGANIPVHGSAPSTRNMKSSAFFMGGSF